MGNTKFHYLVSRRREVGCDLVIHGMYVSTLVDCWIVVDDSGSDL